MRSTPAVPLHPGAFWLGVVAPDRVLSMGEIELFDIKTEYKQITYAEYNC